MEKITPIEIKWVCILLERASRELLAKAKEAEDACDLAPQMMRLKAEQYDDISDRFRNALNHNDMYIEIKY